MSVKMLEGLVSLDLTHLSYLKLSLPVVSALRLISAFTSKYRFIVKYDGRSPLILYGCTGAGRLTVAKQFNVIKLILV